MSAYIEGTTREHELTPVAYEEIQYYSENFDINPRRVVISLLEQLERFIDNKPYDVNKTIGTVHQYDKERDLTEKELQAIEKLRTLQSQPKHSIYDYQNGGKQMKKIKESTMTSGHWIRLMKESDDNDIDINYVRQRREQYKANGFKNLDKDLLKAINKEIVSAADNGYDSISFCLT